jgi:uncharacterized protein YigA (DUF484 family)
MQCAVALDCLQYGQSQRCIAGAPQQLLPLRNNATPWTDAADSTPAGDCTGLLVLASPDPQRFHPSMGTDVLSRIAELAAAALTRLQ